MPIKRIKLSNFKSFKNLDIELSNFNILIGGNASGKSNFIQIFEFLRDIAKIDLKNAISLQGGIEYLRNIKLGSSMNFSVEILFEQEDNPFHLMVSNRKENFTVGFRNNKTIYGLEIKFKDGDSDFEIINEKLDLECDFSKFYLKEKENIPKKSEDLGPGKISFKKINGDIKQELNLPKGISIERDYFLPIFLKKIETSSDLLLKSPLFYYIVDLEKNFRDISIYDFDPKLPKKASPITGKAELEGNGENLSIILKNIIENKEKKRKLSNLIKDILPFIDEMNVEKFADKSLLFKLKEIYYKNQYLPASLISDGTINLTALIVALYFEEKQLTIIEEPERNIHPYLISKLINMMKDASKNKQIIITTHNPLIVKYADAKDLLLVTRDKDGFSTIIRPTEKEEIKTFLENEMGIDELFIQNLLEL